LKKTKVRIIFLNLFLAVGGIVAALILLEIGTRFMPSPYRDPGNSAEICSAQLGWRGKPNFQTTVGTEGYFHNLTLNSAGMHDQEHQTAKPANTFRILVLGDSFMRAHQVEEGETAHQVMENLLNSEDPSRRFEVINAGTDGWGTGQELLYYRREGRFYQPDMVILMLFLGNDVQDNLPGRGITANGRNCYTSYFVLCGNRLDPEPWLYAPGIPAPTGQCGWGQKALVNTLGKIYQSSRLYVQLEPLVAVRLPKVSALNYYTQKNEMFDYAWQLTLSLVSQLRTEVKQNGAEFGVVLISPSDLVDFTRASTEEREAIYQKLPSLRRAEQMEPPGQVLAKTFSAEGIKVLDLLPIFVQHIDQTGEELYFEADQHWNVAGNRLAGQSVRNWVLNLNH
jgi:hypothetical protein